MAIVTRTKIMTKPILTTNRLKNTLRNRLNSLTCGRVSDISMSAMASADIVIVSLFVTDPGVKPPIGNVYYQVYQYYYGGNYQSYSLNIWIILANDGVYG